MAKNHLFAAINLPEKIKKELFLLQDNWPEIPARWIKKENLHLTLSFLGIFSEKKLREIREAVEKTARETEPFDLSIVKVVYGPPGSKIPQMIWSLTDCSQELFNLENNLNSRLSEMKTENIRTDKKEFFPHITMARIKGWELRRMEQEEIPEINEEIFLKFKVNSIEIMKSSLKKGGPEYAVLESILLNS